MEAAGVFRARLASALRLTRCMLAHRGPNQLREKRYAVFGSKGDIFLNVVSWICVLVSRLLKISVWLSHLDRIPEPKKRKTSWTAHFAVHYKRLQGRVFVLSSSKNVPILFKLIFLIQYMMAHLGCWIKNLISAEHKSTWYWDRCVVAMEKTCWPRCYN